MGTWGPGPFDNDAAADLCGELAEADPTERAVIVRQALTEIAGQGDYLDIPDGEAAVAAAAVIASQVSQAALPSWANVPAFLAEGGHIATTPDLVPIAVQALDRVMGEESEWRDEWEGSAEWPTMVGLITHLRAALSG